MIRTEPEDLGSSLLSDISELEGLDIEELRSVDLSELITALIPIRLNEMHDGTADGLAAQSLMSAVTASSDFDSGNAVYLVVFDTDAEGTEASACFVSVIKNGNGCYDLRAYPIFTGTAARWILEEAEGMSVKEQIEALDLTD